MLYSSQVNEAVDQFNSHTHSFKGRKVIKRLRITKGIKDEFLKNPTPRGDSGKFITHDALVHLDVSPDGGAEPRNREAVETNIVEAGQLGNRLGVTIMQGTRSYRSSNMTPEAAQAFADWVQTDEGQKTLEVIRALNKKRYEAMEMLRKEHKASKK